MNKKILLNVLEYNEDLKKLSSSFSCGNFYIDNFLKSNESLESDICKTFVMVQSEMENEQTTDKLVGFYSISADSVYSLDDTSSGNKIIYDGGAVRIHMFAIDEGFQHKTLKIGEEKKTYASVLLLDCFEQINHIVNNHIGATYIILYATNLGYGLYKNVGNFEELTDADDIYLSTIEGSEECIPMYKYIKDDYI